MRGLKGKTAIVAGAAHGNIGGATAVRLAQEGVKVVAADLNEAAAQAVVDKIKSAGAHAVARGFDITDARRPGRHRGYGGVFVLGR
jgi:NAD(P)-dependent dehydrogenase (short-subunit alcohol dehydrogenase family)